MMLAFSSRHALRALVVALASLALAGTASAQATSKSSRSTKSASKSTKKAAPPPETPVPDADPEQVKAAELVYYGKYDCEFNQSLDVAQDAKHPAYVELKSGKSKWLMKPVLSSTGAIRLEDVKGETLMVQISVKSMLLNVKTAKRIVDDCVSTRQRELIEEARLAKVAEAATPAASGADATSAASPAASTPR